MGRAALDEEAIRLIEANNQDLQFDWTRILKGQADPDTPSAPERQNLRTEKDRQGGRPSQERRVTRTTEARPARQIPPEPPSLEPDTPAEAPPHPLSDEPMTAAHARLGFEGLARLRARYSETMARISERIQDAEQQAQLKSLAERLNPDAWVTNADVNAGLESYETTFEALRGTIGSRRRNARPEAAGAARPERSETE